MRTSLAAILRHYPRSIPSEAWRAQVLLKGTTRNTSLAIHTLGSKIRILYHQTLHCMQFIRLRLHGCGLEVRWAALMRRLTAAQLSAVVVMYSRRLQIQERLTQQVCTANNHSPTCDIAAPACSRNSTCLSSG